MKKEGRRKARAAVLAGNDVGVDVDDMDAEGAPAELPGPGNDEEWDGTEEMRKRKLDEYMDELHGLEFNDIVRALFISSQVSHIDMTLFKDWGGPSHSFQVCASAEI